MAISYREGPCYDELSNCLANDSHTADKSLFDYIFEKYNSKLCGHSQYAIEVDGYTIYTETTVGHEVVPPIPSNGEWDALALQQAPWMFEEERYWQHGHSYYDPQYETVYGMAIGHNPEPIWEAPSTECGYRLNTEPSLHTLEAGYAWSIVYYVTNDITQWSVIHDGSEVECPDCYVEIEGFCEQVDCGPEYEWTGILPDCCKRMCPPGYTLQPDGTCELIQGGPPITGGCELEFGELITGDCEGSAITGDCEGDMITGSCN